MDLLVTASNPPSIWQFEDDKISKIEFRDFTSISLIPENYIDLPPIPYDLATPILQYLFVTYLKERDYYLALECCRVSKYYLNRFYNGIYRASNNKPIDLFRRLSRTFMVCEAIDDYLCSPCYEFQSIALRLSRPGFIDDVPLRPWQFGPYTMTEEIPPHFTIGYELIHPIHIGETNSHTVWLQGAYHAGGVFKATNIFHPVINLILCDSADMILPINKNLIRNFYFLKFATLLKVIYGDRVVVNYMVKEDDNPFVVLSETFINFY